MSTPLHSPGRLAPATTPPAADTAAAVTVEGVLEAVAGTDPVVVPGVGAMLAAAARTAGQLRPLLRGSVGLAGEGVRILRGEPSCPPPAGDRRFSDPAWSQNPAFSRLATTYFAACAAADHLVAELEARRGPDENARFLVNGLRAAFAPTNFLLTNPAALKHAFDTGGASVVRGVRNLASDLRHNGGMPSTVDRTAYRVGRDMAVTPGSVIHRDDMAELLAYRPTTPTVRQRPLLIVPPPIGRYYFLDLRPGRSFVEHLVDHGFSTHLISWRNPDRQRSHWDLDAYAARVLTAVDAVRAATGSQDVNVIGFCAGGLLTATVLNHLAAGRDDRVHAAGFAVTLLDYGVPAPLGAFNSPQLLALARSRSHRNGVVSARSLGAVFSWMRPDDLIFNYVISNWLLGEAPPAFDILAWNADGTNLPAALHADFVKIFEDNLLCTPGELTVLGTPVDLSSITLPVYVTGAVKDHLTPWKGTYRTTQLTGGEATFVLSNAGHIQALVNPPGNPKATYTVGGAPGPDPDRWLASARMERGSWWEHWTAWLAERSGDERPAPEPGTGALPVLDEAPGRYVRDARP